MNADEIRRRLREAADQSPADGPLGEMSRLGSAGVVAQSLTAREIRDLARALPAGPVRRQLLRSAERREQVAALEAAWRLNES